MIKELYDLCDMLVTDIRNFNAKGNISPTELERVYKAVDIIKDIKTIEAMEDYGDDEGYSERRYYYDNDMRYTRDNGSSYRRGRDSMGRYVSRDNVYGDKEEMLRAIEEMKRKIEEM